MITVLGATGNVGRKVAEMLKKRGEKVRLVARSADRLRGLVGKQAEAMAGDARDIEFLAQAFQGASAVFTLIPPDLSAENGLDYADTVGKSIVRAVEMAGIGHVVNLSSVGAELEEGTGPIVGLHNQEGRLNSVPRLNVVHLRAAYFMENLLMNIGTIRSKGIMAGAIKGDLRFPMIAVKDIAFFAAERLQKRDFTGPSVRYLLGKQDLSLAEAAVTIGIKIGKPNLRYVTVPYDDAERELVQAGLSRDMSRLYVEMSRSFNERRITAARTPESTTETSFDEFCSEVFVPAYMQKRAA